MTALNRARDIDRGLPGRRLDRHLDGAAQHRDWTKRLVAPALAQDQINALRRFSGNVTLRDRPSTPSIPWQSWGKVSAAEASG